MNRNLIYTEYIASMGMSRVAMTRCRSKLIKLGLIPNQYSPEELKDLTIQMSGKGYKCEWCGNSTSILHEHHYPIPKHKGGTEIVKICPNCHCTYHKLYTCNEDSNETE